MTNLEEFRRELEIECLAADGDLKDAERILHAAVERRDLAHRRMQRAYDLLKSLNTYLKTTADEEVPL